MAENYRHIVRVANTDINGAKQLMHALTKIKGVGLMYSHAVCAASGMETTRKLGNLTDEEVRRIDEIVKNPLKFGIPEWIVNRRKDPASGKDTHLLTNDLIFTRDNDIKTMKKLKTWKGVRHIFGQPVRGQSTRSNFRENKGKVMGVRVTTKKSGTT